MDVTMIMKAHEMFLYIHFKRIIEQIKIFMKKVLVLWLSIGLWHSHGQCQTTSEDFKARLLSKHSIDLTTLIGNDDIVIVEGNNVFVDGILQPGLFAFDNNLALIPFSATHDGKITDVAFQSDGKIIIVGNFSQFNSSNLLNVVRLNKDGSVDNTFTPPDTVRQAIPIAVAVDSNQKIILLTENAVFRLSDNGSLDSDFHAGVIPAALGGDVLIQPNGRIVLASFGEFKLRDGPGAGYGVGKLIGLTPTGAVDNSFNVYRFPYNNFTRLGILRQDGENIIVATGQRESGHSAFQQAIARVLANGQVDNSFNPPESQVVYSVERQPSGKLLVKSSLGFIRLNLDGSIDETFKFNAEQEVQKYWLDAQGMILANTSEGLKVFDQDGVEVGEPLAKVRGPASINKILRRNETSILLLGNTSEYQAHSCKQLFSVKLNGEFDGTFNFYSDRAPTTIAVRNDGKVYAAIPDEGGGLVVVNQDGSRDMSFSLKGSGFNNAIKAIEVQSDNKILLGGDFSSYNGDSANAFVRLLEDGNVDPSFHLALPFNKVERFVIQTDNKIILYGSITDSDGVTNDILVRLNTDGSIDDSFNINSSVLGNNIVLGPIESMALTSSNNLLLGGEFRFEGHHLNFAKLASNGSLMTETFNAKFSSGNFHDISIQDDGKFFVAGENLYINGVDVGRIVKFNPDCTVDDSFTNTIIFNGGVNTMLPIGRDLLVGGSFILSVTPFNNAVAKIPDVVVAIQEDEGPIEITVYPNPTSDKIRILAGRLHRQSVIVRITSMAGEIMLEKSFSSSLEYPGYELDLDGVLPTSGIFLVNIIIENKKVATAKLFKL